ncbi:HAD family hydrolase [Azospirillum sp.]|uniref:HAD family hydrolase n=1 Tax=Azospirillum sp. TaxID=34012 RepID=UPI003D7624A0
MTAPLQDLWDAILFDFDGVLCDSNGLKGDAFETLYAEETPEVRAAIRAFHHANGGMPRRDKLRRFEGDILGRPVDETRIAALADRFAATVEQGVVRCAPIPGAAEFVAAHAGRLPLFVISATPHEEMNRIVDARGMRSQFVEVYGSPPAKAETAASIIARHGFRTERVAFVGDAVQDIAAANKLGLPFIGVRDRDGSHPFPEGTLVIEDLRDLEGVLRGLAAGR